MWYEGAHDADSSRLRGKGIGLGSNGLGRLLNKPPKPHRSPGCSKVPLPLPQHLPLPLRVHYWCVKAGLDAEVEAVISN